MGGLIYLSPIFNGATIEAWISNFIPNLTGRVITYPCWGERWSRLVKGAPGEDTRKLTRKLSAWQTTPDLFWLWTYWRIAYQLIVLGFHYIKLHMLNFNIWRNIKIYLHFLPFLDTATLYVLGIPGKQQFYSQYHGCADDMTLVASAQTVLTQFPRISQTQSAPEGILKKLHSRKIRIFNIITSLWRQSDIMTSYWRHKDVIFVSCVHWVCPPLYWWFAALWDNIIFSRCLYLRSACPWKIIHFEYITDKTINLHKDKMI